MKNDKISLSIREAHYLKHENDSKIEVPTDVCWTILFCRQFIKYSRWNQNERENTNKVFNKWFDVVRWCNRSFQKKHEKAIDIKWRMLTALNVRKRKQWIRQKWIAKKKKHKTHFHMKNNVKWHGWMVMLVDGSYFNLQVLVSSSGTNKICLLI